MIVQQTVSVCATCSKTTKTNPKKDGRPRLPNGWRRFDGAMHCKACVRKSWIPRADALPIASPVNGTWEELEQDLLRAWNTCTDLCDHASAVLWAAKFLNQPHPKLYGLGPNLSPHGWDDMPKKSASPCLRAVEKKFRADTYQRELFHRSRTVANHRYPQPLPIHKDGWRLSWENGQPIFECLLPSRRWKLRLRGGKEFRRQLANLKRLTDETRCEAAIYRVRANKSDHRRSHCEKGVAYRIMIKIVSFQPRRPRERTGTLYVRTAPDAFLVAVTPECRTWQVHAQQIRGLVIAHHTRNLRRADDMKAERRRGKKRQRAKASSEKRANKFAQRTASFRSECASWLTNFAIRQRVAEVVYDDSCHDFLPEFNWSGLKDRITGSLAKEGIACRDPDDKEKENLQKWDANNVRKTADLEALAARMRTSWSDRGA